MNPAVRLAEIVTALKQVGLTVLVMGGHAVRFYGISHNTIDYDLHESPQDWYNLPERLGQSALFAGRPPVEGPTWRPLEFRRFLLGGETSPADCSLNVKSHPWIDPTTTRIATRCRRSLCHLSLRTQRQLPQLAPRLPCRKSVGSDRGSPAERLESLVQEPA